MPRTRPWLPALAVAALLAVAGSAAAAAAPASAALADELRRTRILVAGGTGRNGSAIVAALEALGARPRVLARDVAAARQRLPGDHDWVQGDVTKPETLAAAVAGIDVIINAVATNDLDGPNGVVAVDLGGVRNLAAAGKAAGVRRIVLISGASVGRHPSYWAPPMAQGMAVKRATELALAGSGLEYVILRPTGILARPGNAWAIAVQPQVEYQPPPGGPRFGQLGTLPPDDAPPPPGTIARADLAEVAIVAAVDPRAANRVFVVTHGDGPASPAWVERLAELPRE
jgi:uncharacterized protein YbjT (DUF2867 family)